MWVLKVTKDKTDISRITAKTISHIIAKIAEINLEEVIIKNALNRAGDKIKIYKEGGKVYYEIMAPGRTMLDGIEENTSGKAELMFFSGSTPWSDLNKRFPEILEIMDGEICIVDSWYGIGTFYTLEKFGKTRQVKMLTGQLGKEERQNPAKFATEFNKFKKEFNNINIREYSAWWELHDRYIISDNALFIVGHGIKDIGTKESFGIFVSKEIAGSLLIELKKRFDEKWLKAKSV